MGGEAEDDSRVEARRRGSGRGGAAGAWGVTRIARQARGGAAVIERAVPVLRAYGQPIDLATALLREVPVLRALGERECTDAALAEARFVRILSGAGIMTGQLKAAERCPRPSSRPGRT